MEARFQEKWEPVFRPQALQPPPSPPPSSPSPPPSSSSPPPSSSSPPTAVILGLVPRICSRRRIPGGRGRILATRARMTERARVGMEARFQEKWEPVVRPQALQPPPSPPPPSPSPSPPPSSSSPPTAVILGLVPRICSRRRIPGGRGWILATRARMTERARVGMEARFQEKWEPVVRPQALQPPPSPPPPSPSPSPPLSSSPSPPSSSGLSRGSAAGAASPAGVGGSSPQGRG